MIRVVVLAASALTFALNASASPETEAFVDGVAERIVTLEDTQIADEIIDNVNVPLVARFTLGRHARTLPAEDVARFERGFDAFLRTTLNAYSDRFVGAETEVLDSYDRNDRDSVVTTRITAPGYEPNTVRWRLLERDGEWQVVDVEMFGLWLAIEQRAQVGAILGRGGSTIDDALKALKVEDRAQPVAAPASAAP